MAKPKIKVVVLMGGPSAEHEVSLATGREILANLDPKKYAVLPVTITKSGQWLLPRATSRGARKIASGDTGALVRTASAAIGDIAGQKADVVFIALHGKYGEDGVVQGLLEALGMRYTGSGVLASALGMDKPSSLAVFREAGLAVPDFQVLQEINLRKNRNAVVQKLVQRFSLPLVVKPANHGSSVGVSIVKKIGDMARAIREAGKYSNRIIIQRFIRGRELTCGVLENPGGNLQALPPIEIIPKLAGFYDYRSKYANQGSEHVIPPRDLNKKTIAAVQAAACTAHSAIGCSGMSRSDFILGGDGKLYILEINTIPGMTATSLLPQAAAAAGIPFPRLLDTIIHSALKKQ